MDRSWFMVFRHVQVLPRVFGVDLLARGRSEEASQAMREHLQHTLNALAQISRLLEP
ncbi:hypothetical protein [Cupriavidus sp. L7L]|uniref:hypothetical protein n=1 Tax=Cupriavidus sp. L7L TaxID=2546443 RepID=UPI001404CC26